MRQLLFFSILLTQAVSCLADIRPKAHSPSAAESKHGRELLGGVVKRWGGLDQKFKDDRTIPFSGSTGLRDMYPFVTGVVHYQDFRPVGSLTLPHRLTAAEGLETDDCVHEMRIASIGWAPIADPKVFDGPSHIKDFDSDRLQGREIATRRHRFGCTAGSGSSCGGAAV
ncbi:MAG: DUF3641 domain-containing protein [Leptospirales bacterium]|nr:DUF3641 domain-containing protein [Leptospirales bacterium]